MRIWPEFLPSLVSDFGIAISPRWTHLKEFLLRPALADAVILLSPPGTAKHICMPRPGTTARPRVVPVSIAGKACPMTVQIQNLYIQITRFVPIIYLYIILLYIYIYYIIYSCWRDHRSPGCFVCFWLFVCFCLFLCFACTLLHPCAGNMSCYTCRLICQLASNTACYTRWWGVGGGVCNYVLSSVFSCTFF